MSRPPFGSKGSAVPSGRLSRLARFGGMATGVAGGMLAEGARQLASGRRPRVSDLLLTPANAVRVTHQLAQLRGAAMKLGQLMSMDAGDMLPRELTDILSRLRSDAQHMPQGQLRAVLTRAWGPGWRDRFDSFSERPIAAASIGQVHRARTRDGRDLAIKIQYPGVRDSIDSDVNNVASLLRMSGLLPRAINVAPMLAEAKRQLHEEADYAREGECLARFGMLLADDANFVVPGLHADLSTPDVLAMDYVAGVPVESLVNAPQAERDRVVALLVGVTLRELFEFRLMQTDPNFANYRYDPATGQVVLLDFGATRGFPASVPDQYRTLAIAGIAGDGPGVRQAAGDIGFLPDTLPAAYEATVMRMIDMAMAPLRSDVPFDFGDNDVAMRMRGEGLAIALDREVWHVPPMDTLFLQRKIGGIYLLATRLKARVDIARMLAPYLA